jgi:hypothetical protein
MKGSLTIVGIILVCFLIGVGASTLMSTPAQAGSAPAGPSPCSGLCGSKVVCGPHVSCSPESMHYRCHQWVPELWDCSGAWTCGCVALGCGPNCNIE